MTGSYSVPGVCLQVPEGLMKTLWCLKPGGGKKKRPSSQEDDQYSQVKSTSFTCHPIPTPTEIYEPMSLLFLGGIPICPSRQY